MYFYEKQKSFASRPMLLCQDGRVMTYQDVWEQQDCILNKLPARSLIFILCRNEVVPISVYSGCLRKNIVPLLLSANLPDERLYTLIRLYAPSCILLPRNRLHTSCFIQDLPTVVLWQDTNWTFLQIALQRQKLHPDLALLLSTSGSTGSPKLVRLSKNNLQSNAESIASYLLITENDRPITSLPMEYSYGLSVINSHLLRGAMLLITDNDVLNIEFWDFFRRASATSIAGVPHSYALMKRIGIMDMDLPSLSVLTQAGGKLPEELQKEYAEWAAKRGIRFYVMYGQTEATARMSWLPPEMCLKKLGSIGHAIPGGSFTLLSEDTEIHPDSADIASGELIYSGPNVSLGYAENTDDLQKGDENKGLLYTGDLARRDNDGCYYIIGRKKRFVKISGRRISLDELEDLLNSHMSEIVSSAKNSLTVRLPYSRSFLCTGEDDAICIALICDPVPAQEDAALLSEATLDFLLKQTRIRHSAFHVHFLPEIPRTSSGKINYSALKE